VIEVYSFNVFLIQFGWIYIAFYTDILECRQLTWSCKGNLIHICFNGIFSKDLYFVMFIASISVHIVPNWTVSFTVGHYYEDNSSLLWPFIQNKYLMVSCPCMSNGILVLWTRIFLYWEGYDYVYFLQTLSWARVLTWFWYITEWMMDAVLILRTRHAWTKSE
jgi:hypothetical protein